MNKVKRTIKYTDGEVKEKEFDSLGKCLGATMVELVEKDDYFNKIVIENVKAEP